MCVLLRLFMVVFVRFVLDRLAVSYSNPVRTNRETNVFSPPGNMLLGPNSKYMSTFRTSRFLLSLMSRYSILHLGQVIGSRFTI